MLAGPTQAQDAAGHGMNHAMPMAGQGAAGEFQRGMANMDQAMQAVPSTGNPDRDFAQMMIVHHRGAIDMAKTELAYGTDPEMRKAGGGGDRGAGEGDRLHGIVVGETAEIGRVLRSKSLERRFSSC